MPRHRRLGVRDRVAARITLVSAGEWCSRQHARFWSANPGFESLAPQLRRWPAAPAWRRDARPSRGPRARRRPPRRSVARVEARSSSSVFSASTSGEDCCHSVARSMSIASDCSKPSASPPPASSTARKASPRSPSKRSGSASHRVRRPGLPPIARASCGGGRLLFTHDVVVSTSGPCVPAVGRRRRKRQARARSADRRAASRDVGGSGPVARCDPLRDGAARARAVGRERARRCAPACRPHELATGVGLVRDAVGVVGRVAEQRVRQSRPRRRAPSPGPRSG